MINSIRLFPFLSDYYLERLRVQTRQFDFYYEDDIEEKELSEESIDAGNSVFMIKDPTGIWNPDEYNLCFRRKYCLQTFQHLFGPEGLVCRNAKIGIAVIWMSADSKQRGTIKAGSFGFKDRIFECVAEHNFIKGSVRGKIDFSTILYVAEEGNPRRDERHLANEQGYIIGELEKHTIKIDGMGSTFPIFEVSEKGQPLWYVKCDWVDPVTDAFADTVSINLNTAHKSYKYIDRKQHSFNPQLLSEIMASALSIIIEELRLHPEVWEQIMSNEEIDDGSVGAAIRYFSETLGWDLSTPENVSLCARKFFDQRMLS